MGPEITRLRAADFEEAMDFLNLVFSVHAPHDFENLLPAVYQPTDEWMGCNYAIREGRKIRAIVGLYPIRWRVAEVTLKVAGIGAVSTHPKSRGAGLMRALMDHCTGLMAEQGYHISWLGGQRQRYQYFGYERCGAADRFTLTRANLRHSRHDEPGIRFVPLERGDTDRLSVARALHDAQPAACIRDPDNFHNHLRAWHNRPHAAVDLEGRMVGYLVASAAGERVTELVAESEPIALRILEAWAGRSGAESLTVELPPWRGELVRSLGELAEHVESRSTGNFRIFDWATLVDALLEVRRRTSELAPGVVRLGILDYGTLELAVGEDGQRCARTRKSPDWELDAMGAMRLLFGPLPPSHVARLPRGALLLEQWCPLPLCLPGQDGV